MRVLLLTDIHGETEKLAEIVEEEEFDAVLCAGDLSDANEFADYEARLTEVLDIFDRKGKMVKAVPGNMDPEEECVKHLMDRRMNLHKKIGSFEEFEAVGFGGGKTPFDTPFEPSGDEIRNAVSTLFERMRADRKIAVIHQPPANTKLDVVEGDHVGSQEVRELIEEKDFDFVLTGHIHESYGEDELSGTMVVNPGPVLEGRYGVLTVDGDDLETELKKL